VNQDQANVALRIRTIVDEFQALEPRERLELLLEFAENLPPLPAELQAEKERAAHRVHECQTPVFLWVKVVDGRVQIMADVAPEAPTVKGFVGILVEVFSQSRAEEVLAVEPDLVHRLGLSEALGMMRMRGLNAILFYIRNQVRQQFAP
jgi:cysteine desulfuration protein SufE